MILLCQKINCDIYRNIVQLTAFYYRNIHHNFNEKLSENFGQTNEK